MERWRQSVAGCCVVALFLSLPSLAQKAVVTPDGNLSLIRDAAQSIAAGHLENAESELQAVLETAPDDVRALNLFGIIRAQQHRDADAERLFQRTLQLKPDFAGAHMSLGLLYVQMSKVDDAVAQFQEVIRLDPARSDALNALVNVWRDQAHAAVKQGDPEKALALLIQARKTSQKDPNVLYDFGMVALKMSLFPDAVQAFQETLSVRKDDGNALYGLGRAQMALAQYEDAQAAFDAYVRLSPQDPLGHYALGMTLQALQRAPEARSQYETSIELQPEQTESFFQLGVMDLDAENLKDAQDRLERVLKRNPRHAGALAAMGRIKFQQKDYPPAVAFLQKAVAADSSLREAHYYLGLTLARTGRREDSEKELQIASQIEHEEVESHRTVLKIVDPDQSQGAPSTPSN